MQQGQALLELQNTDLEILRAEKRLEELPEKRAILDARHKIRDVEALKTKAAQIVANLERGVSRNEDECAGLTVKIEDEQVRIMSGDITNPKELQHIAREMDALKRRRDKLEMEQMNLMERVESARGQVAKVDAALLQLAKREHGLTEAYKSKGAEMIAAIEAHKARRDELSAGIGPDLLARYETLRASRAGLGAGRLSGQSCTACRMELPTQRVQELSAGPEIGICPNCKRLLVVGGEE